MPLFKSLRSKSSSRKSIASVTSKNDSSTDFGPRSPSSNTFGSVKSTKNATKDTSIAAKSQNLKEVVNPVPSSPSSNPQQSTSPSLMRGEKESNGTKDSNLVRSFSATSYATSIGEDGLAKPRPSELFAGKGVQWGAVKLAGPNVTPSPVATTNSTEDMQHFLKMRRQWKPTFATEDDSERLDSTFQPPKDLTQLSFASGDTIQSQGLMSFKDLDESHKRKESLLSAAPLGGSLWDEAETSKAASNRFAQTKQPPPPLASKDGKPANVRNLSSMSEKSGKNGKNLFGIKKTPSSQAVPTRISSTVKEKEAEDNSVSLVVPRKEEEKKEEAVASAAAPSHPAQEVVEIARAPPVKDVPTTDAPTSTVGISNVSPPDTAAQLEGSNSDHPAEITTTLSADQVGSTQDTIPIEDADKTLTAVDGEKLVVEKDLNTDQSIPTELEKSQEISASQVQGTIAETIS